MIPYSIHIPDISLANTIVFIVLAVVIILSFRPPSIKKGLIPMDDTQELKGLAMLAIIAIHIGYSLVGDWRYLHPLSNFAGVGVDMFLFLSGYGLSMSMLKKPLTPIEFYKKRLIRIFIPFWLIIFILFVMDWTLLNISYSWQTIWQSFVVYFPRADIWGDFNSPLWYMMWLTGFYVLFPLIFNKKYPWISSVIMMIIGFAFTYYSPWDMSANWLHRLHVIAFPLGILIASHTYHNLTYIRLWYGFREKYNTHIASIGIYIMLLVFGYIIWKMDSAKIIEKSHILVLIESKVVLVEQIKSMLLCGLIILGLSFKPFKNYFLYIFGVFSYEIYLLHWPLIARYDIFFHHIPTWGATIVWIIALMILSWGIQKSGIYTLISRQIQKITQ